ncbi:predicted protein [Sclerotinia sclerotiorum 1980 UF-70]|uniref:Uncharacterized protein n=1 Tax=Sclerotinia sclerotiorum (strain ATCC 18683 / 1980 / Ss-1) TaxID=665079 RepID=A7EZL8_SCLS1|nr:predicted protein [Sclerotinia sclerotiorum 1980 UF-70]EDN94910.1 predicted protein [Sclerotinia sclerotiorum 1980 UF-70]
MTYCHYIYASFRGIYEGEESLLSGLQQIRQGDQKVVELKHTLSLHYVPWYNITSFCITTAILIFLNFLALIHSQTFYPQTLSHSYRSDAHLTGMHHREEYDKSRVTASMHIHLTPNLMVPAFMVFFLEQSQN